MRWSAPAVRLAWLPVLGSLLLGPLLSPSSSSLLVNAQDTPVSTPSTSRALVSSSPAPTRLSTTVFRNGTTATLGLPMSASLANTTAATSSSTSTSVISSASANVSSDASAAQNGTSEEDPNKLHTIVDPAFGLLGAILIISGLGIATTGSAHKRLAVFVTYFYSMALIILVLILHFGVEKQVSAPSKGIRVAFLVAALVGGTVAGILSVIFHRGAKVGISPAAGFFFAVCLQSVKDDGLIGPIGLRYLLYMAITAIAFLVGMVPRFFDAAVLVSTSFLGALAFVIGIDCYTAANLKEFLIFNMGFSAIFPKLDSKFPITAPMQIELGMVLLLFCIFIAVQIRLYGLFEEKLRILQKRSKKAQQEDEEEAAADRLGKTLNTDMEKFEHRYSRGFPFVVPGSQKMEQQTLAGSTDMSPVPSSSLMTPKSETIPLLPDLGYAHHTRSSSSFAALASPKEDSQLAQEILEKEQALEEIATLRRNIGEMRSQLSRPQSSGSESSATDGTKPSMQVARTSMTTPPLTSPLLAEHRGSNASFASISAVPMVACSTSPRPASQFAAPRPLSQHSLITTQARPVSKSMSSRPLSQHTLSSSSVPKLSIDARPVRPTYGHPARSLSAGSVAMLNSAPKSGTSPTERRVTGTLPQRPSSQLISPTLGPAPSQQVMDINKLEARHRKRLSELQGSASSHRLASPSIGSEEEGPKGERRRSTTLAGLEAATNAATARSAGQQGSLNGRADATARQQARMSEFGVAPNHSRNQSSASMGTKGHPGSRSVSKSATSPLLPDTIDSRKTSGGGKGDGDWLAY